MTHDMIVIWHSSSLLKKHFALWRLHCHWVYIQSIRAAPVHGKNAELVRSAAKQGVGHMVSSSDRQLKYTPPVTTVVYAQ